MTAECGSVPEPVNVTAADACDASPAVALTTDVSAQRCAGNYTLTRTWTATDSCNNTRSVVQQIYVQVSRHDTMPNLQDTSPPTVATAASDTTVETDGAGNTAQLSTWLDSHAHASATDVCSGASIAWTNNFTQASFVPTCGAAGSVAVEFTAADECGLTASTAATFTIEA